MKTSLFLSLALLITMPNDMCAQTSFVYYKDLIVKTLAYPFQQFWNSSRTAKAITIGIGGLLLFMGRSHLIRKSRPADRPAPQTPLDEIKTELDWLETMLEQYPERNNDYSDVLSRVKPLLNQLPKDEKLLPFSQHYEFLKQINSIKVNLFTIKVVLAHNIRFEHSANILNETERALNFLNLDRTILTSKQEAILNTQQDLFNTLHQQFSSLKIGGRS